MTEPHVISDGGLLCTVSGTFYRAVSAQYIQAAVSGSRAPGRWSRGDQPTLYLSASPEGVEAAMIAHRSARADQLTMVRVGVNAAGILDLRNPEAREAAGVRMEDATAPWQHLVAQKQPPPSWGVRRQIESVGACGLIDPSRKRPGLWHLVLFEWALGGSAEAPVQVHLKTGEGQ